VIRNHIPGNDSNYFNILIYIKIYLVRNFNHHIYCILDYYSYKLKKYVVDICSNSFDDLNSVNLDGIIAK